MIKAIIFDFGQTLVDSADGFRAAEKIAKEKIFEHLFPCGNEDKWKVFLVEYRAIRKSFHETSNFSRPAIWQAVFDWADCQAGQELLGQMETDYWQTVKAQTTPFPEAMDVLAELSNHYQLGVITNTQGMKTSGAHRIALYPEIEQFFETIIIAGESGIPAKPDPEPFQLCLSKMNLEPSEAMYVGDDFQKDVRGSDDAGMHPVWIKHHLVRRNWPQPVPPPAHIITDLEELLDIHISGDLYVNPSIFNRG